MSGLAFPEVRRKAIARFETPPALAAFLAAEALGRLVAGAPRPADRPLVVVDPTCGSGALLGPAVASGALGYGVDIDPEIAAAACHAVGTPLGGRIKVGNALLDPLPPADRPAFVSEHRSLLARLAALRLAGAFATADRLAAPLRRRLADRLPAELRDQAPFCWALEFPEIALEGGFDAVLTNPPWDKLKLLVRECFEPELRNLHEADQRRIRSQLQRNRQVQNALATERKVLAAFRTYLRGKPVPPARGGDSNTYLAVLELAHHLLRPGGALGAIIPGGFRADMSAAPWRERLYCEYDAVGTWGFAARTDAFPAIDQQVALVVGRKAPGAGHVAVHGEARALGELERCEPYDVPIALIRRTAPESAAIPPLADRLDAAIVEKLYAAGPPFATGPWQPVFGRELDMTTDADVFDGVTTGAPLWEGKRIGAFELCPVDARTTGAWPGCQEGCSRVAACPLARRNGRQLWVDEARLGTRDKGHAGHSRVAWRSIARADRLRRLEAALIPPGYRLGNSLNYLVGDTQSPDEKLTLLALLNSFVVEWRFRHLSANNNVNLYAIRQLPMPPGVEPDLARLAGALMHGPSAARAELRLVLEARVAHRFGLSRPELARILAAFRKLPAADAGAILARFDAR